MPRTVARHTGEGALRYYLLVRRNATQSAVSYACNINCTRGYMTKAKSNPQTRAKNVESTLTRLARRLQSAVDTADKERALASAFGDAEIAVSFEGGLSTRTCNAR